MALTKITTSVIAANTLGTANIADNSIDATKIAANSILTRHIDDDQITGDQLADDITIAGNLTVTGNLVTNGASVTNSSTNTTIEDNLIELGTGTTGSPSSDSGIVIERGDSDNAFIGWDESEDKFILGTGSFTGASTGNLTITTAPLVVGALTTSGLSFPTSDGTNGQVLKTDGSGSLTFGDNTTKVDNYTATGDGSTTAFDTGINPGSEVNTWIFIDGVYQQKSEYSYSGSTVTFTTAPQNGASIDVITGTSSNITASDTVLGVYEATTTNTDTYATGISASNENNTWVFVGGVYQPKDSYTFSSGTLTFDANTPTGQKLSVVATKTITAGAVDTSTLAANAVTSAKIASNSILSRHIANNSIVGADISATTQITASTFTGALTGDVTGNVVGNLTGTIQTAAQTNITSVGTLSALTVSGQLTAGGLSYPTSDGTNEQVLRTDGSGNLSFGTISGTTINNNTNNYVITGTGTANTLNGESGLTYDGSTLAVTGTTTTNGLTINTNALRLQSLDTSVNLAESIGDIEFYSNDSSTGGTGVQAKISAVDDTGFGIAYALNFLTGAGANPTERMRISSSGNVLIGHTAAVPIRTIEQRVQISGTNQATAGLSLARYQNGAFAPGIHLAKSRNDTIGAHTIVQDGDRLGDINFYGSDGTDFSNHAATIMCEVDGTPGNDDTPGRLTFHTTADGSGAATERMRIDSAGTVDITTGLISANGAFYYGSSTVAQVSANRNPTTGVIPNASNSSAYLNLNTPAGSSSMEFVLGDAVNTQPSTKMTILGNGDVLIGQTSQTGYAFAQKLVVGDGDNNDGITIQSGSTHQGNLAFNHSDGTTAHGRISYQHNTNYMNFFTNNTERMRIDSSGNLLVNTTSTVSSYSVATFAGDQKGITIYHNGTTPNYRSIYGNQSGNLYFFNGNNEAYLTSAGAWTNASDSRLKTNIRDIEYGLNTVLSSQPRHFERNDVDGTYIGFVAQEMQELIPEVVSGDSEKQLGLDYGSLVAVAFKAIQEQQTIIDDLKSRIEALEE